MRLVTRSDFDGLACAVLLKELGLIDDFLFAHPKDLQDGKVEVGPNDILANVPYVPGAGLWFDHHTSEFDRLKGRQQFEGLSKPAPSCARVIWEYYGGDDHFDVRLRPMMEAVDKVDSANLTAEEILDPPAWILLGYLMDPRTGLGRFRDYRISNYQLMLDMIEHCRTMSAEEILTLPDVQERARRYQDQNERFRQMLTKRTTRVKNLVVVDLRHQDVIYSGNRFLVYTMFPECNVSLQIIWGFRRQNVVFTVGHSILNRSCGVDVGKLMLEFGG
ncbi:MAG: exopolyphosphatase, partial [Desulfovibrionaceae bacterium]